MRELLLQSLKNSLSYSEFLELLDELVKNKNTTGEFTEDRANFTALNFRRIQRLNKTISLNPEQEEHFKHIENRQTWLVFLESWCADGAQTIPVLNKIAKVSENINLRIVLRDENPELMNQFLTEGTRSIPKLIILDQEFDVMTSWGPRTVTATQMVNDYKVEFGSIDSNFKAKLQIWYNKDRGMSIINELANIVQNLEKGSLV